VKIGWHYEFVDPDKILGQINKKLSGKEFRLVYRKQLKNYLQKHSEKYDVIDYDYNCLYYRRAEFSRRPLFVARSVLLAHHFKNIKIPLMSPGSRNYSIRKWKLIIRTLLFSKYNEKLAIRKIQDANLSFMESDLINIPNEDDKQQLINSGIPGEKIVVLPFGISQNRRELFDSIPKEIPVQPVVAFVGTFDYRKGVADFPLILEHIKSAIPDIKFRFLGTAGMFRTKEEVLNHFPESLHNQIEVIERFEPDNLPDLLNNCSIGIFPSYIEGFPFGVLEMLAAGIPVIAYDSPGLSMMLPPRYLVKPGDTKDMSSNVIKMLNSEEILLAAREWAHKRSYQFCWNEIAKKTSNLYLKHINSKG